MAPRRWNMQIFHNLCTVCNPIVCAFVGECNYRLRFFECMFLSEILGCRREKITGSRTNLEVICTPL
jgi:hypothetical protein